MKKKYDFKNRLAEKLYKINGLEKNSLGKYEDLVNIIFGTIREEIIKNGHVYIPELGSFEVTNVYHKKKVQYKEKKTVILKVARGITLKIN